METKQALVIFEGVEIRRVEKDGQQWISALDVAKALEYSNPTVAVKNTVFRNKERFEGYSIWLPLQTKGGVQNTTMSCLYRECKDYRLSYKKDNLIWK